MAKKKPNSLAYLRRKAAKEGWAQWIITPSDERALLDGCWFDPRRAEHPIHFAHNFLRIWEGRFAGQPFDPLPWQSDVLQRVFGWLRHDERGQVVRRHRRAFVFIPKKNGKSPLAALVGLYCLTVDGESGPKVFSAATDINQASIVHEHAIHMVEASAPLQKFLKINRTTKAITCRSNNGVYRALSGEAATKEGLNGSCLLADELHVWRGWDLWNSLKYMFASRDQPLLFATSTAGEDPFGPCWQLYQHSKAVIEGRATDPGLMPFVCELLPGESMDDAAVQKRVNPALGIILTREELQGAVDEASDDTSLATLKRYRFNVWTRGSSRAWPHELWEAAGESYAPRDLKGRECQAALDLSRTRDSSSLVLAFPCEGGLVRLLTWIWIPEGSARKWSKVVPWLEWAAHKHVRVISGDVMEFEPIERKVASLAKHFKILSLRFDQTYAEDVTQRIEKETGIIRVKFAQNWVNFAAACADFERHVVGGTMRHNRNPAFDWQMSNLEFKVDVNGNRRPVKPHGKDDYRRIDGPVAGIMAVGALSGEVVDDESAYDSDDPQDWNLTI